METPTDSIAMNVPVFDSVKAANYGADEYGMKQYVMAFLRKGPNRPTDKVLADSLQKAHLANISKMADEGKLVVAGPFLNDGDLRGIYIFNVATIEEAKQLTETDPAIIAGSLTMELLPWYGSAALIEINALHKTLAKKEF
ncbi:MAG: YciI family protein [Flavobacteriales bacterium]